MRSTVHFFPVSMPGHFRPASNQAFSLRRFSVQNGQVRHWSGLFSYAVQIRRVCLTVVPAVAAAALTGTSLRKTQSYCPRELRDSLRLTRSPILRQNRSIVSSMESFSDLASRAISISLIQTYPGPPVQQLPHCVQVNRRPSAYHGSDSSAWGVITFNFIAAYDSD